MDYNELVAVVGSSLATRMQSAKTASRDKCPTCGVGRGRWCEHRILSPFVRRALAGELPAKVVR